MDMMSVMWQFGVLAAVIIFGIKIGLASGLANLSKKLFACICVGYGGGVYLHMLHHSLLNRLLKLFIVIILFFI